MKKRIMLILTIIIILAAIVVSIILMPNTKSLDLFHRKIAIGIRKNGVYSEMADNEWYGYDIEMATKVFTRLGYKAEFVEIEWQDREQLLKDKKIDCYITTGKDSEQNTFIYSDSYGDIMQGILYKGELPIGEYTDLAQYTCACEESSQTQFVETYIPKEKQIFCNTQQGVLDALKIDTAQVAILDYYFIDQIISTEEYKGYTSGILVGNKEIRFVLREKETKLINNINKQLREMLYNGEVKTIQKTHGLSEYII